MRRDNHTAAEKRAFFTNFRAHPPAKSNLLCRNLSVAAKCTAMRRTVPTVVIAFAAGAVPVPAQHVASGMPAITLTRSIMDSRPVLVAEITNRSPHPICVPAEVIQNDSSIAILLELRDARGRAAPLRRFQGYISPPRPGVVRLEPGATTTGRYNLFRFRAIPGPASIRMSFAFDRCDGTPPSPATSGWQPF